MSLLQQRIKTRLEREADAFSVGGVGHSGVFQLLAPSKARTYLDDAVINAAQKPLYLAYVPHDDTTAELDTLDWNGLSLYVQRVVPVWLRDETALKLLVLTKA